MLLFLFIYMLKCTVYYGLHVLIRKAVKHAFSFPSALNKPRLLEKAKLMGYRRLAHSQQSGYVTNAKLLFPESTENTHPGYIRKGLEEINGVGYRFIRGHTPCKAFCLVFAKAVGTAPVPFALYAPICFYMHLIICNKFSHTVFLSISYEQLLICSFYHTCFPLSRGLPKKFGHRQPFYCRYPKRSLYPRHISKSIIRQKPRVTPSVAAIPFRPSCASGSSSSATTYTIAPAAKDKKHGRAG